MLVCAAALSLFLADGLQNGDFEAPKADQAIPGWELEFGARNGGSEPASRVEIDAAVQHGGHGSLHLAGDDKVRGWYAARQEFEARPGAQYSLSAFLKTKDVRVERVAGGTVQQYSNCYVGLFARTVDGRIVGNAYARATLPTSDWEQCTAVMQAPESARSIEVYAFLSMSGDLWVDDVALAVEGGRALPAPETVFVEGFDRAPTIGQDWKLELGASNAYDGPASTVRVATTVGAGGTAHSLYFMGSEETKKWNCLVREVDANPGDMFFLGAEFKTRDVHKEGIQFENLHVALEFTSPDGHAVGGKAYAFGPHGTSDWTHAEAKALTPQGANRLRVVAFLSMSGEAWIDHIELTRRGGASPSYGDWQALESKHVVVRFPKDHPRRTGMREYAESLDATYESIRRALAIEYADKITVYLYTNKDQGRRFTGRTLAFAEPETHSVHQTMENTLGHEMAHVIALGVGYAQAPLFGEGLGVWLDGEPADGHHARAAALLHEDQLPALDELLARFREDEKRTYPAAGSFVGFVIDTCGLDAFKRIYVAPDPVASAPEVLGASLADLDARWRAMLAKRP